MTRLKQITNDICNRYAEQLDIMEMLLHPVEMTENELEFHRNELEKLGYTYEKCMAEPHEDIDEQYLKDVFKA